MIKEEILEEKNIISTSKNSVDKLKAEQYQLNRGLMNWEIGQQKISILKNRETNV